MLRSPRRLGAGATIFPITSTGRSCSGSRREVFRPLRCCLRPSLFQHRYCGTRALDQDGLVVALPLTAIAIVVYPIVTRTAPQEDLGDVPPRTIETVLFGVALGLLVTLTSVGAGAIGVTVLAALYPALPGKRLVGSDITPHASRGLGHLGLDNVDGSLLLALLCGSIPGILIGARLAGVVPERVLRPILAVTLCYAAYALYKK